MRVIGSASISSTLSDIASRHHPARRLVPAGHLMQPKARIANDGPCRGTFVGQQAELAGEYHELDFDWAEHAATMAPLVSRQQELGRAAFRERHRPPPAEPEELSHGSSISNRSSVGSNGHVASSTRQAANGKHVAPTRSMQSASPLGALSALQHEGALDVNLHGVSHQVSNHTFPAVQPADASVPLASDFGAAAAALPAHCMPATSAPESGAHDSTATAVHGRCDAAASGSPGQSAGEAARPALLEATGTAADDAGFSASSSRSTHLRIDARTAAQSISAAAAAAATEGQVAKGGTGREDPWEVFYRLHPRARFFKERRYLLLEFPVLSRQSPPLHVVELGCGCGSSLLPVLRSNPAATAYGVDISATCVQQLCDAAASVGIAEHRLQTLVADCTATAATCVDAATPYQVSAAAAVATPPHAAADGNGAGVTDADAHAAAAPATAATAATNHHDQQQQPSQQQRQLQHSISLNSTSVAGDSAPAAALPSSSSTPCDTLIPCAITIAVTIDPRGTHVGGECGHGVAGVTTSSTPPPPASPISTSGRDAASTCPSVARPAEEHQTWDTLAAAPDTSNTASAGAHHHPSHSNRPATQPSLARSECASKGSLRHPHLSPSNASLQAASLSPPNPCTLESAISTPSNASALVPAISSPSDPQHITEMATPADADRGCAAAINCCHGDVSPTAAVASASMAVAPWAVGMAADVVLIVFTLSAVGSAAQVAMLRNAHAALQPGGLLLLRDHGLYDMVQLRIPPEQWVAENSYIRGDGTHAFFFTLEDLDAKARAAGFRQVELRYVCVANRNRRTGVELRRVFVHGVFQKL